MNDKESHGHTSPGKPFSLRPSALSTSTSFDTSFLQRNKSSLLRPSALTAIADKIESGATDAKKRKASQEDVQDLNASQDDSSKKLKVDSESQKGSLQLTKAVTPPQGIGTFGFINSDATAKDSANTDDSSKKNTESHGYIFGEGIKERVTGFKDISDPATSSLDAQNTSVVSEKEQEQRLADNASEHMKKEQSAKLHLTEIEVITGEEGERNVLQVQCKMHLLCPDKSTWIEKGRGILKLNDICKSEKYDIFQSRIVFRRQGSHQVVLNTLLWPEMCYDKATSKSLRITALDPETEKINIHLVTGSQRDITQLHTAIDRRVIALKRNQRETVCDEDSNLVEEESSQSSIGGAEETVSTVRGTVNNANVESSCQQNDSGNSNDSMERET